MYTCTLFAACIPLYIILYIIESEISKRKLCRVFLCLQLFVLIFAIKCSTFEE